MAITEGDKFGGLFEIDYIKDEFDGWIFEQRQQHLNYVLVRLLSVWNVKVSWILINYSTYVIQMLEYAWDAIYFTIPYDHISFKITGLEKKQ